ncbi:oligosaccharide flippase family protein [Halobacillus sp. BAB-2008]|uniref:oligosaccharide flippase family protein n=1 Tax=Halobacillus sp. BAB-2008 TaxID=1246484 RepID=UPI0002A4F92E|nr:oligosaccharide flippase family protein [Halobacillus sp. BAB-2008]ELK44154.1 polysaccharide biosynthesis protein [Halobacillus sp. BAB-2008]
MSKLNKLLFNDVSILWSSQLIAVFLSFITQLMLTRYFPVDDYGALSTALTLTTILGTFAALGTGQNWLRNFGKEGWEAFRWVRPTVKINFLSISFSSLICVLLLLLSDVSQLTKQISLLFIFVILSRGLSSLAEATYQLEEEFKKLSLIKSLLHIFRFITVLVVLIYSNNIMDVAIGYTISSIILSLIFIGIIKRTYSFKIVLKGHGKQKYIEEKYTIKL